MSGAAKKTLDDALALPEDERLQIASEIIASVDGPPDAVMRSPGTHAFPEHLSGSKVMRRTMVAAA